ncbi:hypothetical protein [Microterricola viridarii]|uniref:Uncharacterized protein n=1 Tax=Microterricola viridarii TaxID=412690 RepID=A0A0X8E2B8_9MICO|nr:hypothetical protein [Microterricola viridarii]AMB58763.1 hypothetical protein AWU67_07685 [Microterricola viridarii]
MPARATEVAEELWARVLTELESELEIEPAAESEAELGPADSVGDDASHVSFAGSGMWSAPAQLPVLPESLRERADALYQRQNEREAELLAERADVLRHLEALRSVPRPRAAASSVYLDVSG